MKAEHLKLGAQEHFQHWKQRMERWRPPGMLVLPEVLSQETVAAQAPLAHLREQTHAQPTPRSCARTSCRHVSSAGGDMHRAARGCSGSREAGVALKPGAAAALLPLGTAP